MPPKPHTPGKRSFYLDQSHLCEALRAHFVGSGSGPSHPAYLPVLPWLERVATEANLCLSFAHILEFARWGDRDAADAAMKWLDARPFVWCSMLHQVHEREDEHWLNVALGRTPAEPCTPYVPTFASMVKHLSPGFVMEFLHDPTLLGLVRKARKLEPNKESEFSRQTAAMFRNDRSQAEARGMSEEDKRDAVQYNLLVDLRKRAVEAHNRLWLKDPSYVALDLSRSQYMDKLADIYASDPHSLPTFRLVHQFSDEFAKVAVARTPGSRGDRDLDSSTLDLTHAAAGAGYCWVFTCDNLTDKILGGVRESFGLPRQLSTGRLGGPEKFVEALMATWP
jgi:hypothetical protein